MWRTRIRCSDEQDEKRSEFKQQTTHSQYINLFLFQEITVNVTVLASRLIDMNQSVTLQSKLFLSLLQEKEERYLMLFTNVLVMLSASPRMSGFIYQVH